MRHLLISSHSSQCRRYRYVHMYELSILGEEDVALAQAWLSDLVRLGYAFPRVES